MNEKVDIKIGDFVRQHLDKITNFLEQNPNELNELQTLEYSKKVFETIPYPFIKKLDEIEEADINTKYWKDIYIINNIEYRFCSQLGGSKENNKGIIRSQRDGNSFLEYLKGKELLLEQYRNKDIVFIVGSNNTQQESTTTNISDKSSIINIKNIILYGSPGVGKTFNHKKLIALIEGRDFSQKDVFDFIVNNKDDEIQEGSVETLFDKVQNEKRMQFVTFHQSFGYEDFIEGFRPNDEGHIKLTKGIFREICEEAQKNLEDSQKEESIISQEKIFEEIFELFKENIQDKLDKKGKFVINDTAYIINIEEDAFRYQGDNWGNTQRMKYSDIELLYQLNISERKEIKSIEGISGLAKQHATYFSYFMKKFFDFAQKQNIQVEEVKKVERKTYYIVIDEINRANISKVFGELITLIEEDKRDTLEVTLPYSKTPFKIPSNLYIIGTMNSTDKSIALLDIALRRRFTFLKMKPNPDLIKHTKAQKIFNDLNGYIKESHLGEDYQIGHSYFMKIVNDDDLAFVLEYKIKPLLEEYFYGDDRLAEIIQICNNKEQTDENK